MRGLTASGIQLFISIGQLIANLVLKGTGTLESRAAYKIPFALQFVFPVCLLVGLPFSPESPWFLVRTQKVEQAIETLSRLGYQYPLESLKEISKTIAHEDTNHSGTSYLDCFRNSDLKRTEIAMGIMATGQLTGVVRIPFRTSVIPTAAYVL